MLLHPRPDGRRRAATITCDVDGDSLGRYGPTIAVPRILDICRRPGLRQTFLMPGWVMEAYPATAEAFLAGRHETGHRSWRHGARPGIPTSARPSASAAPSTPTSA